MSTPTQDRAAVLKYLDRLGREIEKEEGSSLADFIGEARQPGFQSRIDILAGSSEPDEEEMKSLEAIVRGAMRPMLPMVNEQLQIDQAEAGPWLPSLTSNRSTLERAATAVGRILLRGHPSLSWVGSGFHIGEGLVLTTRHVAATFAEGDGQPVPSAGITAEFESASGSGLTHCLITEILVIDRELNIAILQTEGLGADCPALELDGAEELPRDKYVAVIGHRSGLGTTEANDLFASPAPAVKLVSPGRIVGYEHAQILDEKMWCIAHDCSTLTGFAGGPLIDLETGRALGVHFASQEATPGLLASGGFAIPISELARDARARGLGLGFTPSSPQPVFTPSDGTPLETPVSASASTPESPAELVITQVEGALRSRFSNKANLDHHSLSQLIEFLESLGSDYERAVAAQPGRERVEPDIYCHALVVALARRGLITPELQGALGIQPEPSLVSGKPSDPNLNFEDAKDIALRIRQYPLGEIERAEQLSLLVGSPYWETITGGASEPPEISDIVDHLVEDASAEARAALVWLEGRLRDYMAAVASPTDASQLVPTSWEMVGLAYFREGLEAARSVGKLVSKKRSGCTCWLITPDLVVAPAHVIGTLVSLQGSVALAAATKTDQLTEQGVAIEFEDETGRPRRAGVKEVAFLDNGLDIMLVRLKQRDPSRPPLQIRMDLLSTGPIASIHHAHLHRKMLSVHGGRLISNDGFEVKYILATAAGVGGAPIFDTNWQVIATHRARIPIAIGADTRVEGKLGTSVAAMVQRIRESPSFAKLWREIAGAQRVLRSIDPVLQVDGNGPSQRIVIELINERTKLDKIAGLKSLSRVGRIETAIATPKAIGRLAGRQGVVSVEASRSTAEPECVRSIPHIGADRVCKHWQETGDKALIAVIDSGVDIYHETFLDANGQTRILVFWDQQDARSGPAEESATISTEARQFVLKYGLRGGAVYLATDIELLRSGSPAPKSLPPAQIMAHGTVVCSIAAGRETGTGPNDFAGGVAPGSPLIVIRYDLADASVGYSGGHVNALEFVDRYATDLGLPVVVNVSNGMNGGAHDGKAKVEVACAGFCVQGQKPGRVVVKSAGNERQRHRHAELKVPAGAVKKLRFFYDAQSPVRPGRTTLEQIQIWMPPFNQYEFSLKTPSGHSTPPLKRDAPLLDEFFENGNRLRAQYSSLAAENGRPLLQLDLYPGQNTDLEHGTWQIDIRGIHVASSDPLHAWIELNSSRSIQFVDSTVETNTITVPGNTEYVITVGAVEVNETGLVSYDYSSMGPTLSNIMKPDIVAPGVSIVGAGAGMKRGRDAGPRSGTSLAAPHVTGSIALVLSAWQKRDAANMPNMIQIRTKLVESSVGFNLLGDSQLGYGRLNTEEFFRTSAPQ